MKLIQKESYERSYLKLTAFDSDDVIFTSDPVETGNNGLPFIPITKAPVTSVPKNPMNNMDNKNNW